MELKDQLNLLWKYLFLSVFTYAVINLTCCKDNSDCCKTQGNNKTTPCAVNNQEVVKKGCGSNCSKPCCDK